MSQVLVRYRVKPDQAEENVRLVRAVYEELHSTRPTGMHYATLQLEDVVSFVHIHRDDGEPSGALTRLPAFKEFQLGIRERCEEGPVVSELSVVGSYRVFDELD